ncbi:uncharacterized protein si:dkey-5i3.5 isoform X2 [Esox lucius]|uniref:uncharacterized protein si:dkey-5i3.5 isoform X2 n=1 Tax=Esox lucius TaxID=8010 RepID=UPI00147698F9|nr:uncharacterized protein si:dkey-5i3.5 isoform X2 [Esox lucius]
MSVLIAPASTIRGDTASHRYSLSDLDMSVMVGRVNVQRVTRSITYYYTSRTPWGNSSSHSPPTLSPLPSKTDTPPTSRPNLSDLPSHPVVSSSLTPSTSDVPKHSASLTSTPTRPLLLLFPWLGARPSAVAKYQNIYLDRGLDVLTVNSDVWHFLWPRWGLEYAAEVLDILDDHRFKGRPLLVHAFSIGGYTFSQMLTQVVRAPDKYPGLAQRVVGHVYDSMVVGTLEHMATGLGKTMFPRVEPLVRHTAMFYFWLFKSKTVDYYDRAIKVIYDNPITAPALFFFCENDALCDPVAVEAIIDTWRRRGVTVDAKKWKESVHAGHLRCHPEEYLSTLERCLNLPLIRSKM